MTALRRLTDEERAALEPGFSFVQAYVRADDYEGLREALLAEARAEAAAMSADLPGHRPSGRTRRS